MPNQETINNFYAQAEFFLTSAQLATKHYEENHTTHPVAYNNFKTVIVGTSHSFAIEILIKGILVAEGAQLNSDGFVLGKENKPINTHNLEALMKQLDENFTTELKCSWNEREARDGTVCDFDTLINSHSDMFTKMRYACAKKPPNLKMDFTSFMTQKLKCKMKKFIPENG